MFIEQNYDLNPYLSHGNTASAWFQYSSYGICNHCAFKTKLFLPPYLMIDNFRSAFNKNVML